MKFKTFTKISILLFSIFTALARLTVNDENGHYREIEDVPSDPAFGPLIPNEGITGRLVLSKPDIFGCKAINFNSSSDQNLFFGNSQNSTEIPIVALISRSFPKDPDACSFSQKVFNAERAGAKLAVIFDYTVEPLFHMELSNDVSFSGEWFDEEKIEEEKDFRVGIPAIMISQASGEILTKMLEYCTNPLGPLVFADNADPYQQLLVSINMTMVGVISGFLLTMLLCTLMFFCSGRRDIRRHGSFGSQNRPISLSQAEKLPELVLDLKNENSKDCCSICLEMYRNGDKILALNCGHFMHKKCLVPWLSERQRTCPLCKADVLAPKTSSKKAWKGSYVKYYGSSDVEENLPNNQGS